MYGLKYHASCLDYYGNEIRCEIYGKDYSGDAKEMEFGEDAVKLVRTNKAITEPICGMGVKIQVWCNTDAEYIDLFATSDKQHMVVVYRAGAVVFRGFVEPDLFNEEFIAPPYTITIPAADGLAGLSDYTPVLDFSQEKATLLSLIRACLSETGLELPIFINCSLFPDDVQADTLFETVYVETSVFRTLAEGIWQVDDAQKILGDILRPFSCRIYQANDAWYIERIKNKCDASWKWVRYDLDGSKATIADFHTVTLDTDEALFMDNPASLEMDSGYGKQTVKIDYKKYDSVILINPEKGSTLAPDLANFYVGTERKRWYYTEVFRVGPDNIEIHNPLTFFTNKKGIERGVSQGDINIYNISTRKFFQRSVISHDKHDKLKVNFKIGIDPRSEDDKIYVFYFDIALRAADGDQASPILFLTKGEGDNYSWSESGRTLEYVFDKESYFKDGFDKFVTISFSVDLPSYELIGSYRKDILCVFSRMHPPSSNVFIQNSAERTYIGDIQITTENQKEIDNTFTATVNTKYRRKAPDINLQFYDLPWVDKDETASASTENESNINYSHGLSIGDALTDYTTSWRDEVEDSTQKDKLYERLLIDNFDQYYDPREKLSGDVLTNVPISPEKLFRVAGRDKYYLLTGLEYRMAEAMYKVSVEEIKKRQVTINTGNE